MNKEQKTYNIRMCVEFTYEYKVKASNEDSAIEKTRESIICNRTSEDITIVEEDNIKDVYCLDCIEEV